MTRIKIDESDDDDVSSVSVASSSCSDLLSDTSRNPQDDQPVCRKYYQIFCVLCGSMGLFSNGIFTATSGCILPQLEAENDDLQITEEEGSWFAGFGFMVGIAGSLFGGYECELLGRKTCLMIENALVFGSMILMSVAPSFIYLMIGRTIHGYCSGAIFGAVPVYVSEVCQPSVRSMAGGAGAAFYSFGTTAVYTLGALLHWRRIMLACSLFPLLNFVMLIFASESPTWFLLRGRNEDSLDNLNKLRGNQVVASKEHKALLDSFQKRQDCATETKDIPKWKMVLEMLRSPTFLFPLASIAVIKVFGGHLAGFAPLGMYMNKIIIQIGVPGNPYWIGAGIMIFRAVISLFGSVFLKYLTRRVLFTICSTIIVIGDIVLGVSIQFNLPELLGVENSAVFKWIPVFGISLLYFAQACGLFNVIMCFQGELMPSYGRAMGSGLIGVFDALVLFSVGKFLPLLNRSIGLGNIFFIQGGLCLGAVAYLWYCVPETKGLSLEEIEEHYRAQCHRQTKEDNSNESKRFNQLSTYDNMSMWGDELKGDNRQPVLTENTVRV